MDKNILTVSFSRLNKLDFQNLAESVITIVEKHNPENLQIKEIFDKLVELEPQIELLTYGYASHWLTPKINKLRRNRNAFTRGLLDRMRTIEDGEIEGMQQSIEIAKPTAIKYLLGLSRKREKTKVQIISQFLGLVENDEELAGAIEQLGLMSYIDNLKLVTREIAMLYYQRRESTSARPKAETLKHVADIKTAILNLFKQIEVAQLKHAELDYKPLIDELNHEMTDAKAGLRSRASYNKKKAEAAIDNDDVVVESQPEESSEPAETTPEINMMRVVKNDNENSDELDIKKTIAVSTKQSRLPNVSSEA